MERARMGATGRLSLAACLLSGAVFAESALPAGKALPISVDTRTVTERRMLEPDLIRYSPRYVTETNAPGSYVVLKKVVDAGTAQAVTSTVATCEADAEGGLALQLGADDARLLRLIHEVRSSDGDLLGASLIAEVSYGVESSQTAAFLCYTATNALQQIADAGGTIPMNYSPAWVEGAVSNEIVRTRTYGPKGRTPDVDVDLLVADDAPGVFAYAVDKGQGGTNAFRLAFFDVNGLEIPDSALTCGYWLKFHAGLLLFIR